MELTLREIEQNRAAFLQAGISLPGYDVRAAREKAVKAPVWVHFGIGNIFRVFIGEIADGLMEAGLMDRGITCAETYDGDIIDQIYTPHDNLALRVILNPDGTREMKVLGSFGESIRAVAEQKAENTQFARLKAVFESSSLQLASFTVTEKGYQLHDPNGEMLPYVARDMREGPAHPAGMIAILTAALFARFNAGGVPIALVSMDNCAQNGKLLKRSVLETARTWLENGFVGDAFVRWLEDESRVAFDSTMIDKITPRPADEIAETLEAAGLRGMRPVITGKRTYIAPFINAERPQYLVIEDRFPNGRPPLEKGFGVYMGDFDTVCKCERMKVTACLNPAHTALGPYGVVLGQEKFADMLLGIPAALAMAKRVIYTEGIPVVEDPGILSPVSFADEVFERFTNLYLGDTNLRLATDASQGLGVRFGETVKSYVRRYGSAERLTAIPFGIAGFFRYMMGVDDNGMSYTLAPDPLAEEIRSALKTVRFGHPETLTDQLRPYLSNPVLFNTDLYAAGIGEKIEALLREMIAGKGAAYRTLLKYS